VTALHYVKILARQNDIHNKAIHMSPVTPQNWGLSLSFALFFRIRNIAAICIHHSHATLVSSSKTTTLNSGDNLGHISEPIC